MDGQANGRWMGVAYTYHTVHKYMMALCGGLFDISISIIEDILVPCAL